MSFFGALALLVLFTDSEDLPIFNSWMAKTIYMFFFLAVVVLIWFTIADLKRVEQQDDYLYVTNYFKTYRYHKDDISRFKSYEMGIFEVISIHMREKTKMGKKIRFLSDNKGVKPFLDQWLF